MKAFAAFVAAAMMIASLCFLPTKAGYAAWADAQARSQVANQMLADNMQHLR